MKINLLVIISFLLLAVMSSFSNVTINDITEDNCFISVTESSENAYFLIIKTNKKEIFNYKDLNFSDKIKNHYFYETLEKFTETSKILFKSTYPVQFSLEGLNSQTEYFVDVVFPDGKVVSNSFSTFAKEPQKQASGIIFKNAEATTLITLWNNGDGEGCLVVCSKDVITDLPIDGIDYKANASFGDKNAKIGNNAFVLFKGKHTRGEDLLITNLEYANYHFQIFEYNGDGKFINYNTKNDKNNPRKKHTILPAPTLKNSKAIGNSNYSIAWNDIKDATTYILDVAYDKEFTKFVEDFKGSDIGKLNEYVINVPMNNSSKSFFVRMKAIDDITTSRYSNILEIVFEK